MTSDTVFRAKVTHYFRTLALSPLIFFVSTKKMPIDRDVTQELFVSLASKQL